MKNFKLKRSHLYQKILHHKTIRKTIQKIMLTMQFKVCIKSHLLTASIIIDKK